VEYVAGNDVPVRLAELARVQENYRRVFGVLDRSHAAGAAQSFQAIVGLNDDGTTGVDRLMVL
jgi:hypothetical protein